MITVHHLNNSRSQRILWMLEELGLDYEVKLYQREPSMQAPASLRAVHPLGKSPVITDGGKTLAESGAILEYLVETYGNGRFTPPPGTPERLRYTYFLHYAEGSLMPLLFMKLVFTRLPERVPWAMRPVARMISAGADKALLGPQISNHFGFLEGELAGRDWFAGALFSAADVFTLPTIYDPFSNACLEALATGVPKQRRQISSLFGIRKCSLCSSDSARWSSLQNYET